MAAVDAEYAEVTRVRTEYASASSPPRAGPYGGRLFGTRPPRTTTATRPELLCPGLGSDGSDHAPAWVEAAQHRLADNLRRGPGLRHLVNVRPGEAEGRLSNRSGAAVPQ